MGDLMLHGVLNMPPDLWSGDAIDVMQRHGRYLQASQRIKDDEHEIERLRAGFKRIRASSDSEMMDGDLARDIADEMLKTPNVELTGAAQLYRAASSD